jgi:hypothetical protein
MKRTYPKEAYKSDKTIPKSTVQLPFKKGDTVICKDSDADAKRNTTFNEIIYDDQKYIVKDCKVDTVEKSGFHVILEGFRTEWNAGSFYKS